ncbi:MAG: hydroxymethylbilane synthase [Chlamydiae bacterium RIFCSPHIGHO2_12_FULL_49_9]|nr:MAG: hydroxymethylbilane synthase [Chlamydiae bacterium RIFCSPHIGHO2_12_FULL_49_9]
MRQSKKFSFKTCARDSALSRAQVEEIAAFFPEIEFEMIWIKTTGDLDQKTSLRALDKTDFFTRELDQMLLKKEARIAIHSAKDLPDPILDGLEIVAITEGVDPRDSLVFKSLSDKAIIATSSARREEAVKRLGGDFRFVDIRGTIEERLKKLEGEIDGVVVAEAALVRLKLTHLNRIFLQGETAPMQGKLAVVARQKDEEMKELFEKIDARSLSRA